MCAIHKTADIVIVVLVGLCNCYYCCCCHYGDDDDGTAMAVVRRGVSSLATPLLAATTNTPTSLLPVLAVEV